MAPAASEWRTELARPLLAAYAALSGVTAAALSGSAARGTADRWSDVEAMVFWSRPPRDREREDAAASGGATPRRFFAYVEDERIWCDDLSAGSEDVLVEVTHLLVATAEEHLDRLLRRCEPDPLLLNFAQGVVDAVPASGDGLLEEWRQRLAVYPEELRVAVIRRTAQVDHFWRWRMFVERRNPMLLAAATADIAGRLYATMLALNGRYGPGLKSPDALAQPFELAPPEFALRLRGSFGLAPEAQAAALTALILETYDLIEQHVPEVDVARLRQIFGHTRTAAGPPSA